MPWCYRTKTADGQSVERLRRLRHRCDPRRSTVDPNPNAKYVFGQTFIAIQAARLRSQAAGEEDGVRQRNAAQKILYERRGLWENIIGLAEPEELDDFCAEYSITTWRSGGSRL